MIHPGSILIPFALLVIGITCCSDTTSGIIHRPATGCPPGSKEVANMFERNGVQSPACIWPDREPVFDYLMPGESMHMTLELPGRPPIPKEKGKS